MSVDLKLVSKIGGDGHMSRDSMTTKEPKDIRGVSTYIVHIHDKVVVTVDTLYAITEANQLGLTTFIAVSHSNHLWILMHGRKLPSPSKFKLPVVDPVNIQWYVLCQGGKSAEKHCHVLRSFINFATVSYATLRVIRTPIEEPTTEDMFNVVSGWTKHQWNCNHGDAQLAVARQKATDVQSAMCVIYRKLDLFLNAEWAAGLAVHLIAHKRNIQTFEDLPAWLQSTVGYIWLPVEKQYRSVTLRDAVFGELCFDASIMLAGASGIGKTNVLHIILHTMAIMNGSDSYLCVNELDDCGTLTRSGETATAGAYGFDDCAMVSNGARPLNVEERKNLFVIRTGSGYNARYCPSSFRPLIGKVFACNLSSSGVDPSKTFVPATNSIEHTFRWLRASAKGDATAMLAIQPSVNEHAEARKCVVFAFDDKQTLFTDKQIASFTTDNAQLIRERAARYATFKDSRACM
jgi:hypothetical protein